MISQSKIREWVNLYLTHVNEITPEVHVKDEEGYKFKSDRVALSSSTRGSSHVDV
jgi:hypothetical protein